MLTCEKALKELTDIYHQNRIQLKKYQPLFLLLHRYGDLFSKNHKYSSDGTRFSYIIYATGIATISCITLDLHMGKKDSILLDIMPIVDDIKGLDNVEFTERSDYEEMKWAGWNFKYYISEEKDYVHFKIRAFFEYTTKCKVVGTGKFEEKLKVVCE